MSQNIQSCVVNVLLSFDEVVFRFTQNMGRMARPVVVTYLQEYIELNPFIMYAFPQTAWTTIHLAYHQPNKIMAYLTFHKWLVLVCNIYMSLWMLQTKTSQLWKVSYAIILLGWQNISWYEPISNCVRTAVLRGLR